MVRRIAATALFLLCVSCAGMERMREASEAEAGVRATLTAQVAAWNAGDVMGFMAGYMPSERTTFLSGTTLTRGQATVADRFLARYPKGKMGKLEFRDVEITGMPSGDSAYAVGQFRLTGETQQSGMFTLIFARMADRYLIVHDHTSAESRPATESAPVGH